MMSGSLTSGRLFCAAVALAALTIIAAGQAATRVIEWGPAQKGLLYVGDSASETDYYAVEVREITVEGKPVAVGRPFAAAADWAKTLTLKVRNTSGRPIRRLRVILSLPEWKGERGVGHGAVVLTYPLGETGAAQGELSRSGGLMWAVLKPDEEAELSLRCEATLCARHLAALAEASAAHRITRAELHSVWADFDGREFWWGFYVPARSP
ncbi:MAG TPA: hypothetical protein VGW12_15210 [Pyrinomonadaceae bacterium]|nr:hypothetical protein [Pyrinomonadaceae bacterium]